VEEHGVPAAHVVATSWGSIVAEAAGWSATEAARADLFFVFSGLSLPAPPSHYPLSGSTPCSTQGLRRFKTIRESRRGGGNSVQERVEETAASYVESEERLTHGLHQAAVHSFEVTRYAVR
jgi:hypothetical protein